MFIESAFFRFNEALVSNWAQKYDFNEEQIRGLFAQSIIDELSSRLVPYPSLMVQVQRTYPIARDVKKRLVADIYTSFEKGASHSVFSNYGFAAENWIEVKYFSMPKSKKRTTVRLTNAASILKDILRLIILTGAKKPAPKRYLLLVFDNIPRNYLARKTREGSLREWVDALFDEQAAKQTLRIAIAGERRHFIETIGKKNRITAIDLRVSLQCFVPTFEYLDKNEFGSSVYSYLVRIDDFAVNLPEKVIPTSDV